MPWFSKYTHANEILSKPDGVTDLFKREVRLVREEFHMLKVAGALEAISDYWRPSLLQDRHVLIQVARFQYGEFGQMRGTFTPVFRLQVRIANALPPQSATLKIIRTATGTGHLDDEGNPRPFFDRPLNVVFPEDYPSCPPMFQPDHPLHTTSIGSHSHHRFSGGWLCILANRGDWDYEKDNIISGLNAAFDWIVWHRKTYGW